ncbi:sugar ABC transporter permease [Acidaminobacter sp. JC074]|uniref:ABC transporter permease n=1 Tax=Acidaminobacter sp. JC074 TaxID=2530199 RepID=UPI001F0E36BE|nr:ABC transporter permease subunit [Acidaminobacter sp. JC074]MCH4887617.1 sugar ABC transporter permease [Acidaminobacter sp. JC074]
MSIAREDYSETSLPINERFVSGVKRFLGAVGLELKRNYQLYLMVLPAVLLIFIFRYIPMYGVQIAFKDFVPTKGITGSEWVGFKHFIRFFESYNFWDILKNTLGLSLYQLIVGFPFPIILALILNQIKHNPFKKMVQTVTYIPHFVSVVVVIGMLTLFTSPDKGIIAHLFTMFGMEPINFMGEAKWFKSLYVFSGIWQSAGWGSIIYLAALAGVDPSLYEAASIDGASKWQKILYIDIPSIVPTAIILLLLNTGKLMSIGFEKVYLMQNPLNQSTSEIISTYVYKMGLLNSQYSYSAAIGLFNTMINFVLLITLNRIAKKANQTSLW